MNGRLIPDTPIMVDLWKRVANPSSRHYFLSHMHSDHTQGLSSSWRWPIYCSPVSAKLLVDKFQIKELLVRPLELNQSHLIRLDPHGKETMTVTLFDANHCPGSVMFLFEGYFGRILYTGDFRYDASTYPKACLGPERPVDKLYLDNTFNNPRCRFPSRAECKREILELLKTYSDHEVVLGVYTLGKEDLLVDIALALNTRIVVSPARMRTLQLLQLLDVFTTNKDEGRVRLLHRRAISKKNMAMWNEEYPTIAIIPTGLFSSLDGQPYANQDDVFIIPYSDHSSYPELRQFVSRVRPRAIIPIVKDSSFMNSDHLVADMHNFDDLLERTPSEPFDIPPAVLQFMFTDNPSDLSHLRKDLKNIQLRRVLSGGQRSNHTSARGVVYLDDDNEEQTQSADSSEEPGGSVDSQQQKPAESRESSETSDGETMQQEMISDSSYDARGHENTTLNTTLNPAKERNKAVPPTSAEEGIDSTSSKAVKPSANPISLTREGSASSSLTEGRRDPKPSQDKHEENHIPQRTSAKRTNLLTETSKRKSDEISKEEQCRGEGTSLNIHDVIRSMSNKRRRILPAFSGNTPKLPENVKSRGNFGIGTEATHVKLPSRRIQDYFKALTDAAPASLKSVSVPTCEQHARFKLDPCNVKASSSSAAASYQDADVAGVLPSASGAISQGERAVSGADVLILAKAQPCRGTTIEDTRWSHRDERHPSIRSQEAVETPATSPGRNLANAFSRKSADDDASSYCVTRPFSERLCVKPIGQTVRQKNISLGEAFRVFFPEKL